MTQSIESMIEVQRKQIEALTAQVVVLRGALRSLIEFEMLDSGARDSDELCYEFKQAIVAYNTTPEASLAEVRKAEREKCAALCEQSDRYRGDYFAAKIRAMGDE